MKIKYRNNIRNSLWNRKVCISCVGKELIFYWPSEYYDPPQKDNDFPRKLTIENWPKFKKILSLCYSTTLRSSGTYKCKQNYEFSPQLFGFRFRLLYYSTVVCTTAAGIQSIFCISILLMFNYFKSWLLFFKVLFH